MDSYTWHPASNGFLYPSLTLLIMETILELTQIGLFGLCHPREKYFIWFTTHNGLLTTHKLHTINNITQSPHCPLCLNHPEDQDHIYSKACNVKNLKIYGIALMLILLFFFFFLETFASLDWRKLQKQHCSFNFNNMGNYFYLCVLKNIWMSRNKFIFQKIPFTTSVIKRNAVFSAIE